MSKVITSKYDYGVQLYGNLPGESLKNLLSWRIAVINGTTYASETDGMKDFSAYLITKPMNDLEFSVSDYNRYIATGSKYETHYGVSGKYETDMVFLLLSI